MRKIKHWDVNSQKFHLHNLIIYIYECLMMYVYHFIQHIYLFSWVFQIFKTIKARSKSLYTGLVFIDLNVFLSSGHSLLKPQSHTRKRWVIISGSLSLFASLLFFSRSSFLSLEAHRVIFPSRTYCFSGYRQFWFLLWVFGSLVTSRKLQVPQWVRRFSAECELSHFRSSWYRYPRFGFVGSQ